MTTTRLLPIEQPQPSQGLADAILIMLRASAGGADARHLAMASHASLQLVAELATLTRDGCDLLIKLGPQLPGVERPLVTVDTTAPRVVEG